MVNGLFLKEHFLVLHSKLLHQIHHIDPPWGNCTWSTCLTSSFNHSHTDETASGAVQAVEFSLSAKDTSTCWLQLAAIRPPTSSSVDSRPTTLQPSNKQSNNPHPQIFIIYLPTCHNQKPTKHIYPVICCFGEIELRVNHCCLSDDDWTY